MKRVEFDCICELANVMDDYILDNAPTGEYPIVSTYANYEVAKALVEALIMLGNPIGAILELEDYEMSHYDKEYVVYLSEDGVTCERNHSKDGYYNGGGDISFVHEDCSSKLLSHIDSKVIYEFAVGECDECYDEDYEDCDYDCDCDECCGCDDTNDKELDIESDDDMHGFSINHSDENGTSSYSFYSTDMDLVEKMAQLFR